jgi:hypothetical protein
MPSYQLRFLGADNKIAGSQIVECDSDPAAFEKAQRFVDGHAVEVWEGTRFIATLERQTEPPKEANK